MRGRPRNVAERAGPGVDWERLAEVPLLRLHAALILGICDPVPMPSPMSEADGAWVREHAWTSALRKIDEPYPYGLYRWCLCQSGTCWNCLVGRCDLCVHRQQGGPDISGHGPARTITDSRGFVVAVFVLRDGERPCRWTCRCPCPKTGLVPDGPAAVVGRSRLTGDRYAADLARAAGTGPAAAGSASSIKHPAAGVAGGDLAAGADGPAGPVHGNGPGPAGPVSCAVPGRRSSTC